MSGLGLLVAMLAGAASFLSAAVSDPGLAMVGPFVQVAAEGSLADSSAFAVVQDQTGFLWFGTDDGLVRFDGQRVVEHRSNLQVSDSLSESDISVLLGDSSGLLWVGTWGGGLHHFDPINETFTRFESRADDPTTLRDGRIQVLLEDRKGTLWIGTFAGGLSRFDEAEGTFESFLPNIDDNRALPSARVWGLAEDSGGGLWVATDHGLAFFDQTRGVEWVLTHDPEDPAGLPHEVVRTVLVDRSGRVWVGLESGFGKVNRETRRFEVFESMDPDAVALQQRPVNTIIEDETGRIWVGTFGAGLFSIDHTHDQVVHYLHQPNRSGSLVHDDVRVLFVDASNLLWIGTRGGGVCRVDLKPAKFISIGADPETPGALSHRAVRSVLEDSSGTLWIGTQEGLNRRRPGEVEFTVIRHDSLAPSGLPSDGVNAILESNDGTLWFGCWGGGLARLDPGSHRFKVLSHQPGDPSSLSGDRISSLAETPDGALWVGTSAGLNRLDRSNNTFRRFSSEPGVPGKLEDDFIQRLYVGRDGTLWVGTDHGGLARYDVEHDSFDVFEAKEAGGLSHSRILAITEDAKGVMWVGSAGGLHTIDPSTGTFEYQPVSAELPSTNIQAIVVDDDGRLWLATSRGLSRWNPANGRLRTFTPSDRVQGYAFSSAFFKTKDGRVYLGGLNGANSFRPELVTENLHEPPVVLTLVRRFDEIVDFGQPLNRIEEITFPYTDNFFTFEFAALEYTDPDRNLFAYRLEGFDRDWIDAGNRTFASYTNVDPGTYVFRVKAANGDGTWNEDGLKVTVHITPPWWQRWWFRATAVVSLALFAFAVVSLRTRSLHHRAEELAKLVAERTRDFERANEAKTAFLANMSHEVRTPLNAVIGMTTLLNKTRLSATQGEYVDQIASSSRMLLDLVRDILDVSRIEAGRVILEKAPFHLSDVLDSVATVAGVRARERGLQLLFHTAERTPCHLRGDALRLEQVILNLTINAIKFTEAGSVCVLVERLSQTEREVTLRFSVTDTGAGIPEDKIVELFEPFTQADPSLTRRQRGVGLGLAISKRLVEAMGGTIAVTSDVGRGSTFSFRVCFRLSGDEELAASQRFPLDRLPGLRVLVVASSTADQSRISDVLDDARCSLGSARGLDDADGQLANARLQGLPYHVVIGVNVDVGLWSVEAVGRLAGARDEPAPRLIVTTSKPGRVDQRWVEETGIEAVLPEPVNRSGLFGALVRATCAGHNLDRAEAPTIRFAEHARILVVEDIDVNRKVVCALLTAAGARVAAVASGQEAIDTLMTESFGAVLMDVQMPMMDGLETTRRIRSGDGPAADIPIIAVTAHAMDGDRERFLSEGMTDYVAKPIEETKLIAVLARYLPVVEVIEEEVITAESGLPTDIPGIDVHGGLGRVAGNEETYVYLVHSFLAKARVTIDRLREDLINELGEAQVVAHTLKGTAANLGLTGLTDAAKELEQAIRDGKDWSPAFESLSSELTTAEFGAARFKRRKPDLEPVMKAPDADSKTLVVILDHQLADNNLKARVVFKQLQSVLAGRAPEATKRLAACLIDLDFETARQHLTDIKSEIDLS